MGKDRGGVRGLVRDGSVLFIKFRKDSVWDLEFFVSVYIDFFLFGKWIDF